MRISLEETKFRPWTGAVLAATLIVSFSNVFAGELQRGATETARAAPKGTTRNQGESRSGSITRVSLNSGAPYICTPSGFGQKGTCIDR